MKDCWDQHDYRSQGTKKQIIDYYNSTVVFPDSQLY